jgi:hypothetical protein
LLQLASDPATASLASRPGWVFETTAGGSWLRRHFGGLWANVSEGVMATAAVAAITLPFAVVWLGSWWAGWENSFNKGYEQAWVGPTLALAGIFLGVAILHHLPMLLAHAAAEGRLSAFADVGTVRQLIRAERWRYLALTAASVALAAPLLLFQIAMAFLPNARPDLVSAEALAAVAGRWHLLATFYLVLALVVVRLWAARLYARAAFVVRPPAARLVLAVSDGVPVREAPARGRFGELVTGLAGAACWLAFLSGLYVGQFVNHAWWNWLNHPMIGLPWLFRVFG